MIKKCVFSFFRKFTPLLILLCLLSLLLPASVAVADGPVNIPDPYLEAIIRGLIGKPVPEEILQSDLEAIIILPASSSGITDLTGLEYCTNLEKLNIALNEISDLSPLGNLTSLTWLWAQVNDISDISPLSDLFSLEHIELYNNSIIDVSALTNLTNLNWLWLHANQISDITPLVDNGGLSGGDWVTVCYNPLDEDSVNIDIPALRGRGVYISCPVATEDGGCFIATAAYGTSTAEELNTLRAFRDEVLLESAVGSQLVEWYYQTSPPVADFISEHEGLRTLVRELLVDPVAWLVEATEAIWGE
jgi:hypothetical protein